MNEAISLSLSIICDPSTPFGSGFWKLLWCIFLSEQIALSKSIMNNHIIADVNGVGSNITYPVDKCDLISFEISSLQRT